ncbi:hypothetical protein Hanom_Chr14g01286691 [Helianthus anomalus]
MHKYGRREARMGQLQGKKYLLEMYGTMACRFFFVCYLRYLKLTCTRVIFYGCKQAEPSRARPQLGLSFVFKTRAQLIGSFQPRARLIYYLLINILNKNYINNKLVRARHASFFKF